MAKQYKTHKEVETKHKWNIKEILQGKKIEDLFKEYEKIMKKRIKNKDSKFESATKFLADLKDNEKEIQLGYRISNYINNSISLNVVDSKMNKLYSDFSFLNHNLETELGSEESRIIKHASKVSKWIKDKKFDLFRKHIQSILDLKKHTLSKEVEEYRIKSARGNVSTDSIFSVLTNTELKFDDAVDSKGKKYPVNNATLSSLMMNKDAKVRKSASLSYANGYLKNKDTLSLVLNEHFKSIVTEAKVTNFNSTIESLIFSDRVKPELLQNLYSTLQENLPIFKKYSNAKKKFYKKVYGKAMTAYDGRMPLVKEKSEYTIEDAEKLVVEALKPFGKEYTDVLKKGLKERWVDYMPVKNKRSGAYSIGGSFGIDKKYILMNFDGKLRSVETLAHEFGHSMHSYFSDTRQKTTRTSAYPIFLAEIASIFNELMLSDYLIKNSKSDKLKFSLLGNSIDGFVGTVHRQLLWSNYEFDLYTAIEKGQEFTNFDMISKLYADNLKKYEFTGYYKGTDEDHYGAIMVPHYYYGFYMYKYAIGQLVGNIFFKKYKEEGAAALQSYIDKFLSAGASKWPLDILKDSGIDLMDKKTLAKGFESFEDMVDEWIKLGNKVIK